MCKYMMTISPVDFSFNDCNYLIYSLKWPLGEPKYSRVELNSIIYTQPPEFSFEWRDRTESPTRKTPYVLSWTIPWNPDKLPEGTSTNHVFRIHFCNIYTSVVWNFSIMYFEKLKNNHEKSRYHAGPSGTVQAQCDAWLVQLHC